jgi:uncharacterized membrane protein YozB (DUF420 family)
MVGALHELGFFGRGPLYADLVLVAVTAALALLVAGVVAVRRGRRHLHAVLMGSALTAVVLVVAAILVVRANAPNRSTARLSPVLAVHVVSAVAASACGMAALGLGLASLQPAGATAGRRRAHHRASGRLALVLVATAAATGLWSYVASYGPPSPADPAGAGATAAGGIL